MANLTYTTDGLITTGIGECILLSPVIITNTQTDSFSISLDNGKSILGKTTPTLEEAKQWCDAYYTEAFYPT